VTVGFRHNCIFQVEEGISGHVSGLMETFVSPKVASYRVLARIQVACLCSCIINVLEAHLMSDEPGVQGALHILMWTLCGLLWSSHSQGCVTSGQGRLDFTQVLCLSPYSNSSFWSCFGHLIPQNKVRKLPNWADYRWTKALTWLSFMAAFMSLWVACACLAGKGPYDYMHHLFGYLHILAFS